MNHDTLNHNQRSLYQAVIDNPTDLDARRVYADFLAEQQDPRGELILHHFTTEESPPWTKDYLQSKFASDDLLKEHHEAWEAEWLKNLRESKSKIRKPRNRRLNRLIEESEYPLGITWAYRYGFIDRFRATQISSLDCLSTMKAFAPIRHLEIDLMLFQDTWGEPDLAELTNMSHFGLRLNDRHASAKSKKFPNFVDYIDPDKLESLRIEFYQGRKAGATKIAETDFRKLTKLDLSRMNFSDEELAILASANWFSNIAHLSLLGNRFGELAIPAIKSSRVGQSLKSLNLKLSNINDPMILELAADGFPNLQKLGIGWWFKTNLSPRGVEGLLTKDVTPNLNSLNLECWEMDDETLKAFLDSETGTQVSELVMPSIKEDQTLFFSTKEFPNLKLLNLQCSSLSGRALEKLLSSPLASNLNALNLSGATEPAKERYNIFETPAMDSLLYLDLSEGAICNKTMKGLTKSSRLSGLLGLNLRGCTLSKKSLSMLVHSNLDSLKYVRLPEEPTGSIGRELNLRFRGVHFN